MAYLELMNDNIFDLVNLGKTINDFNEDSGDYIKVEIFKANTDNKLGTLYSNRLMLKYSEADSFHLDDYHFHSENPEMGFCTGREHTDKSQSNLLPVSIDSGGISDIFTGGSFKKQLNIYKDGSGNIYIKPNEVIKLIFNVRGKYRLRIHFLRNIKSLLGKFLHNQFGASNLIENGNFFAGLEAMQTGDLDRSSGKNNFIRMVNPGFSKFVLEQNGLAGNTYKMLVTGIEPNSSYVFSCWVAWANGFNGSNGIVSFSDVHPDGGISGMAAVKHTTEQGSFRDDPDDRFIGIKKVDGLTWFRLYAFMRTTGIPNQTGTVLIDVGNSGHIFSINPLGRRYFTDLRFEKVEGLDGQLIDDYLLKLTLDISEEGKSEYHNLVVNARQERKKMREKRRNFMRKQTTLNKLTKLQIEEEKQNVSEIDISNILSKNLFKKPEEQETINLPSEQSSADMAAKEAGIMRSIEREYTRLFPGDSCDCPDHSFDVIDSNNEIILNQSGCESIRCSNGDKAVWTPTKASFEFVEIGKVLTGRGYVTQEQLDVVESAKLKGPIGPLLVGMGIITKEQLIDAMAGYEKPTSVVTDRTITFRELRKQTKTSAPQSTTSAGVPSMTVGGKIKKRKSFKIFTNTRSRPKPTKRAGGRRGRK